MTFKLVDPDYNGMDALGGDAITDFDFGPILWLQEIITPFRIGNLNATETDFYITTSGVNSTIITEVDYSLDNKATWGSSMTVSGVQPNSITQNLYCRYTNPSDAATCSGSFLIHIEEV
jgi:hypothetical protein